MLHTGLRCPNQRLCKMSTWSDFAKPQVAIVAVAKFVISAGSYFFLSESHHPILMKPISSYKCTRCIQKASAVCKYCCRSATIANVSMRAEFLYPLASQRTFLDTVFFLSLDLFLCNMFKTTGRPSACEMQSAIPFMNSRNVEPADIHQ